MELHERFMKFTGAESSIFKVIADSSVLQESIDSIIRRYLEDSFGKLTINDVCKKDLELLRRLLCQLYKFNDERNQNGRIELSIEFNQLVDFLKNNDLCIDKGNQAILYDIIVLYLIIFIDLKNFLQVFEELQSTYTRTLFQDINKLSIDKYLKLLHCFFSTWEILNYLHQEKKFGYTNKTHLLESCKHKLLSLVLHGIQTLVKYNENGEWQALQSVLSKIVSLSQNTKILSPLMDEILEKNVTLSTLCALSDFLFPMNSFSNDPDYCLLHNRHLLRIIQDNLHTECPHKRKEAIYLLKKMMEFIDANDETLSSLDITKCLGFIPGAINPFVCNNSQRNSIPMKQVRTNFILVLEALEEKQKHLVTPCLPLVETLILAVSQHKICGNCFDISWLYCVFTRLLKHYHSAIVKWGLLRILKLPRAFISYSFLLLIIHTLNNTFLYEKSDPYVNLSESNLTTALTRWFIQLQNTNDELLIEYFLHHLSNVQWGPVPIFYVLQSLFHASLKFDNMLRWDEKLFNTIKRLIRQNIILYSPMLRSMSHVQLIQLLARTGRIKDLRNLINFFAVFPEEDLKVRGILPVLRIVFEKMEYSKVAKCVKSICDGFRDDDQQVTISMSIFSFVIKLLYESKVICQTDQCSVTQELKALLLCLDKIDVRPYIKLSVITKIIAFINGFYNWNFQPPDCIRIFLNSYKETIFKFILKLFQNEAFEYQDIEIYDETLRNIFDILNANLYSKGLEFKCTQVLDNAAQHSTAQILFALKLWSNISHHYKYNDKLFLQKIKNIIALSKSQKHCNEITGKAGSDFYTSISKLIKNHLSTLNLDDLKTNNDWLDLSSFILDAAGNQVLIYLSDVAKKYSTVVGEDTKKLEDFKLLIKSFWSCNFGSKRDKIFWLVTQKLTECINSSEFLQNQALHDVSKDFIDRMLIEGESLPGLKYILLTCSNVDQNFNHFTQVLLNGLLHGQVLRRDQRIHMQACIENKPIFKIDYGVTEDQLENFNAYEFLNKQCNVDTSVRTAAVTQLCKALEVNRENADILLPLILEKLSSVQNKRYFADSQLHRLKHRIMQSLLILQPYLNKESTEFLYHILRDSILEDTDQHSVRLMREWLLIRMYLSNEDFLSDLWDFFDMVCNERPNSASYLIGIIWHIGKKMSKESLEEFGSHILPKLGICCLGQQFGMRLFGQVFFVKIYNLLPKASSVRKEHVSLYNTISTSLYCGNMKKNPVRLNKDFFYAVFDPEFHYSLETIYHQLPRLSNVRSEEFITKENFKEQIFSTNSIVNARIDNSDQELDGSVIPYSILKSSEKSKPEEIEFFAVTSIDVQKKITPWRTTLSNEDDLDEMTSKTKSTKDLIVIASLIDKPQNLGGIARTCEIFGAKELVISNLKQIEDKEFQALSVSADKWIKMTEAKAFQLPKYLMELKNDGWTLVGAEQTANSVNLIDYKFPKQTVLVLGNEKNGIPANIIPLLDVCVEIPQYGIIRSLNVHVTSAICIWEYNKQHLIVS